MAAPPHNLDERERSARVRLARTPFVGPATFRQLLAHCGSAEAALAALPELSARGGRPLRPLAARIVETERRRLEKRGGRQLVWGDADYPAALAALGDAPPVLSVLGSVAALAEPGIAIVGARNASASGQRLAAELAAGLAASGRHVVSGLARGIDTAAHRGAGPARTVAVLAGGVDVVYPPENAELHAAIVQGGGAVVSEEPFGREPTARHFPRRNRIISGLSRGVVVVEASLRSGSLITARAALEQGREVMAVPGFPYDPRSTGPNSLIRDGAALVTCVDDVLAALGTPLLRRAEAPSEAPGEDRISLPAEVDKARERILLCLRPEPTPVDEVLRRCEVSAPIVHTVLLELELAGRLERHPGNLVSLLR
ncbi:MAG: DNA-protecting protein DprA [Alphaproteobacteria bacterium]|nr:DNA-protecting protein DprA [Alphaproteobacteria bacterium]